MKTEYQITKQLQAIIARIPKLESILSEIRAATGIPYLVGGCVRDLLLGAPLKDIDIEVHKLSLEALEKLLGTFGIVRVVGKQFGVLRIDGIDIDWSLPRRDSKGRKPVVELVPDMSIEDALRRRDVTMNSLAVNLGPLLSGKEIVVTDPYGGQKDIQAKRLRAVDATLFCDDPLRFYRVMQFIARFEMVPDDELQSLCKKIDLAGVAKERIHEEMSKMLTKAHRPSLGIRWLRELSRLEDIMPELAACIGVKQPPEHHPEGDVFEHAMQSLDAAAQLEIETTPFEKEVLCFAALCHDLGKALVTDAQLHAYDHDKAGVVPTRSFMKRFTDKIVLIETVEKLTLHHLAPGLFLDQNAGVKAYKRLAKKCAPLVSLRLLGLLWLCDKRGRNQKEPAPLTSGFEEYSAFLDRAGQAQVTEGPEAPVLLGRHLLEVMAPGPKLGEMLNRAYEIQIEEGIRDPEILKKRVLQEKEQIDE